MDYTHSNDPTYPGGPDDTAINASGTPAPGGAPKLYEDVPANAVLIRNLAMASNYLMSHILHFYHLVALDYVDVNGTGLIPKGFLCPNYDSNYYARGIDPVLQTGGLGAPAYTVNNAPLANPGVPTGVAGDLTPYLAGQYVRALKARRMAHQLGAIFAGKMPHASCFTPGCVTTKSYDPTPGGLFDGPVVQKVHELLYGGPGFDPTAGGNHPCNGNPLSMSNPHPESLMGFIGKPSDFWNWAADATGSTGGLGFGFAPEFLPPWAAAGAATSGPLAGLLGSGTWKHGGTFCFDTVAAAHCFPEYFWIGSGYGRYLAWGIFEGAAPGHPDQRLLTRGRVHVPLAPNGGAYVYHYKHHAAKHLKVTKEFTTNSWYDDPAGINYGRHMWQGKTKPNANKPAAYTFAKTPRYYNNASTAPWEIADHPNDAYLPYEVGPLARMIGSASRLTTPGGPATAGEVVAVDSGAFGCYYPGILSDVDNVLAPVGVGGPSPIGVFPGRGANMAAHIGFLAGAGVFYLPPNAFSPQVLGNGYHSDYMGGATLDRIAARTLETYYVGMQMLNWFNAINPISRSNKTLTFTWNGKPNQTAPKKGKGAGLTEAPRGALGHWIKIHKPGDSAYRGKVSKYQIVTPTAWNISPKDAVDATQKTLGLMGPIERCIWGTPVVAEQEPIEVLRVIHSFDPCCACTVHVMNPKKEKVADVTLEALM